MRKRRSISWRTILLILVLSGVISGCGQSPPAGGAVGGGGGGHARPPVAASNGTLEYWRRANDVFLHFQPQLRSRQPADVVSALRATSSYLRDLPAFGADADVVNWAHDLATVADQKANLIENSNSPALLVEAFLRGADGDPFGVSRELLEAARQWKANYDLIRREGFRLRAVLSSRYRCQFPPCVI